MRLGILVLVVLVAVACQGVSDDDIARQVQAEVERQVAALELPQVPSGPANPPVDPGVQGPAGDSGPPGQIGSTGSRAPSGPQGPPPAATPSVASNSELGLHQGIYEQAIGLATGGRTRYQNWLADQFKPTYADFIFQGSILGGNAQTPPQTFQQYLAARGNTPARVSGDYLAAYGGLTQIHRRDDYAAAERAIGAREGDGPGTIWGRGGPVSVFSCRGETL